ncbi:hypothetical protein [Mycobacterium sp.]|nr:hypothetical protein [Mycobacterium sp.]HZA09513.1 hypothetical protein [Mycobacterium sp.]
MVKCVGGDATGVAGALVGQLRLGELAVGDLISQSGAQLVNR